MRDHRLKKRWHHPYSSLIHKETSPPYFGQLGHGENPLIHNVLKKSVEKDYQK
jgi:hypothetical protein